MRASDLAVLVSYLDRYLRISEVPDAPHALNGLQVANGGTINRAAAAVDLCDATVQMAAQQGADLLLVHHGLFWGGLQPLTARTSRWMCIPRSATTPCWRSGSVSPGGGSSGRSTGCGSACGEKSTSRARSWRSAWERSWAGTLASWRSGPSACGAWALSRERRAR